MSNTTRTTPLLPWPAPWSRAFLRATRSALLAPLVTLLGALALAAFPSAAYAHGSLKSSEPSANARLAAPPTQLRLTFTEAPELAFTTVQLLGSGNTPVALAPLATASDSRRAVVAAIRGVLAAGTYTVVWQMAGADGHPMRGRFSFTVVAGGGGGATDAGAAPSPGQGQPAGEAGATVTAPGQVPPPAQHHDAASMPEGDGFGAGSPAYVGIRWLQYAGLLVVLGTVAFWFAVLGFLRRKQDPDSPMLAVAGHRAARVGLWAALVVGAAALLRLVAQSYALHGAGQLFRGDLVATMLTRTIWGWGWILQVAGVFVAALGFRAAARGRAPGARTGWALAALGAVALSVTPALSGHAASAPDRTALAVIADSAHVIGAGGWLGSLLLVVAVGIPVALGLAEADRGPAVADLVNAFSPTALVFAGTAAVTGVFATWIHVGMIPALWGTTYGRTLLLKLGILSIVAATGAYNWLRVKPVLGDVEGAARIRRSATIELAVGVVVLLVTAVLVATPTAVDMQTMQGMAAMQ